MLSMMMLGRNSICEKFTLTSVRKCALSAAPGAYVTVEYDSIFIYFVAEMCISHVGFALWKRKSCYFRGLR